MKNATARPQQLTLPAARRDAQVLDRSTPLAWLALGMASLLGACATKVVPPPPPAPSPPVAIPAPTAAPAAAPAPAPLVAPAPELVSHAATPRDYRQDGARHLYKHNGHRIFKGQMPPLMHAVGVLQVDIDNLGHVRKINWMRAPSHVPDVMREIERTVRAAAPFPAPVRLGGVTYTDVWLWDKSGNFQLDTLTEGQRLR
jgi:periplasmic protein TonB